MTGVFQTTDAGMQGLIATIENQASNMTASRTTIASLADEIPAGFQCEAVTIYQSKIMDWLEAYDLIKSKFDGLYEDLVQAQNAFLTAHQDAASAAKSVPTS
jgi:hypothetical protein